MRKLVQLASPTQPNPPRGSSRRCRAVHIVVHTLHSRGEAPVIPRGQRFSSLPRKVDSRVKPSGKWARASRAIASHRPVCLILIVLESPARALHRSLSGPASMPFDRRLCHMLSSSHLTFIPSNYIAHVHHLCLQLKLLYNYDPKFGPISCDQGH